MAKHRRSPRLAVSATRGAGGVRHAPVLPESFRLVDHPDRRVSVFSNGLTVIAARHPRAGVSAIRAYVRAGSALEGALGGSGVSHLLEHMVAGGATEGRTARQCADLLDATGGLNNAYTTNDHTCYHLTTTSADVPRAIGLLADWIVRPVLTSALMRREVGVILREMEPDEDDPEIQLDNVHRATLYRFSPMRFPTIGSAEALRRLSLADVLRYHAHTYVPDNVVVVVVSEFAPDEIVPMVQREFAGLGQRPSTTAILADEPEPAGMRRAVKPMAVSAASIVHSWRTVHEPHADTGALDLLADILAGGDSGRLTRRLRWQGELAYEVSSIHESTACAPGFLGVRVRLPVERIREAEAAIDAEFAELSRVGASSAELQRAVARATAGMLFSRQTADGLASELGENFLATGNAEFAEHHLARLRTVTTDDIREAVRRYVRDDRRVVVQIVPAAPTAAKSRSAPRDPDGPIARRRLSNGLSVLIRRTGSDGIVAIGIESRGGLAFETAADNGISNLMIQTMLRGSDKLGPDEVHEQFEGRGALLGGDSGADTIHLICAVHREDLEQLAPVFADLFIRPAFLPREMEKVRPAILDDIRAIDESWEDELMIHAHRCFFGNDGYGRSRIGTLDSVSRLTAADLRGLHQRIVLSRTCVLAVCGDVDPDRVLPLMESCFAGLPDGSALRPCPPLAPRPPDAEQLFVKPARPERQVAGLFVGFPAIAGNDPDRAALAVLQTVLGGYTLSSGRLFRALRGSGRDWVYEVGATMFAPARAGYLAIVTGCEPRRVPQVYRVIRGQVEALRRQLIGPAEQARAIAMISTAEGEALQTPASLVRRYSHDELLGWGTEDVDRFLANVRRVSPADVRRAARRYLTHAVVAVVTPEPQAVQIGIEPRIDSQVRKTG